MSKSTPTLTELLRAGYSEEEASAIAEKRNNVLFDKGFTTFDIAKYDGVFQQDRNLFPNNFFNPNPNDVVNANDKQAYENDPDGLRLLAEEKDRQNNEANIQHQKDSIKYDATIELAIKDDKKKNNETGVPSLLNFAGYGDVDKNYLIDATNQVGLIHIGDYKDILDKNLIDYPDMNKENYSNVFDLIRFAAKASSNNTQKYNKQGDRAGIFNWNLHTDIKTPGGFRQALIITRDAYNQKGEAVPFYIKKALKDNDPTALSPHQEVELLLNLYKKVPVGLRLAIAQGDKEAIVDFYRAYLNSDEEGIEKLKKLLDTPQDQIIADGIDRPFWSSVDYSKGYWDWLDTNVEKFQYYTGGRGRNAILGLGSYDNSYAGRLVNSSLYQLGLLSDEEVQNYLARNDSWYQTQAGGFKAFLGQLITYGVDYPLYSGAGTVTSFLFRMTPRAAIFASGIGSFVGPELLTQGMYQAMQDGNKIRSMKEFMEYSTNAQALDAYTDASIMGFGATLAPFLMRKAGISLLNDNIVKEAGKKSWKRTAGILSADQTVGTAVGLGTGISALEYYHTGDADVLGNLGSGFAFAFSVNLAKFVKQSYLEALRQNKVRTEHYTEGTNENYSLNRGQKDAETHRAEVTAEKFLESKGINIEDSFKFRINEDTSIGKIENIKRTDAGDIIVFTEFGLPIVEKSTNVLKGNSLNTVMWKDSIKKYVIDVPDIVFNISNPDGSQTSFSFDADKPNKNKPVNSSKFSREVLEEVVRQYGTIEGNIEIYQDVYSKLFEYGAESSLLLPQNFEKNLEKWKTDNFQGDKPAYNKNGRRKVREIGTITQKDIIETQQRRTNQTRFNPNTGSFETTYDKTDLVILEVDGIYMGIPRKLYQYLSNPDNVTAKEDKPLVLFTPLQNLTMEEIKSFTYTADIQEVGVLTFFDAKGEPLVSVKPLNVSRLTKEIRRIQKEITEQEQETIIDKGFDKGDNKHEPQYKMESIYNEKTVNQIYNQSTGLDYLDAMMLQIALIGKSMPNLIDDPGKYGSYDFGDNTISLNLAAKLKEAAEGGSPFAILNVETLITLFHEIGHADQGNSDGFKPENFGVEGWMQFINKYGGDFFQLNWQYGVPFDFTVEKMRSRINTWEQAFEAIEKADVEELYRLFGQGNIIGQLTKIKGFIKNTVNKETGEINGVLDGDIIRQAQKEAELAAAQAEKDWQAEVDAMGLKITAKDILSIWNKTNAREALPPELYDKIARSSEALKKDIIKQAMKGLIHEDLKEIIDLINGEETTSFDYKQEVKIRFAEAVQREMDKRGIITLEKVVREIAEISLLIRPAGMKTYMENPNKPGELLKTPVPIALDTYLEFLKLTEEEVLKIMSDGQAFTFSEKILNGNDVERFIHTITRNQKPGYQPYRRSRDEMYADFISALLIHPDLVREKAPNALELFYNHMDNRPEFKKAYEAIITEMNKGQDARIYQGIQTISKDLKEGTRKIAEAYERNARKLKLGSSGGTLIDFVLYHLVSRDSWVNARVEQWRPSLNQGFLNWDYKAESPTGIPNTGRYKEITEGQRVQKQLDDSKNFSAALESYMFELRENVLQPVYEKLQYRAEDPNFFDIYVLMKRLQAIAPQRQQAQFNPYLLLSEQQFVKDLEDIKTKLENDEYDKTLDPAEREQAEKNLELMEKFKPVLESFRTVEDFIDYFDREIPIMKEKQELFGRVTQEFLKQQLNYGATEIMTRAQYEFLVTSFTELDYVTLKPVDKIIEFLEQGEKNASFIGGYKTSFHKGFITTPFSPIYATVEKIAKIAMYAKKNEYLNSMLGKPYDGEYMAESTAKNRFDSKERKLLHLALDGQKGYFIEYKNYIKYFDAWNRFKIGPFSKPPFKFKRKLTAEEKKEFNEFNPTTAYEYEKFVKKYSDLLDLKDEGQIVAEPVEYIGKYDLIEKKVPITFDIFYQLDRDFDTGLVRGIGDRNRQSAIIEYLEMQPETKDFIKPYKEIKNKKLRRGLYLSRKKNKQTGLYDYFITASYKQYNPRADIKDRKKMEKMGYALEKVTQLPREQVTMLIEGIDKQGNQTFKEAIVDTNKIDRTKPARDEFFWVNPYMVYNPADVHAMIKFIYDSITTIKQLYTGANPAFWPANIMMDLGTILQNTDVKLLNIKIKKHKDSLEQYHANDPDVVKRFELLGYEIQVGHSLVSETIRAFKEAKHLFVDTEKLDAISKWLYSEAVLLSRKSKLNLTRTAETELVPREVAKEIEDSMKDVKQHSDFHKNIYDPSYEAVTRGWQVLQHIGKATEFVVRRGAAGYMIKEKQAGRLDKSYNQIQDLLRRNVIDYKQGGQPWLEVPFLFFRAAIQGPYSVLRAEKQGRQEDPRQKWYKRRFWQNTWKYTGSMSLLSGLALYGFFGEEMEKFFRSVNFYDATYNFIFPIGTVEGNAAEKEIFGDAAKRPLYLKWRISPAVMLQKIVIDSILYPILEEARYAFLSKDSIRGNLERIHGSGRTVPIVRGDSSYIAKENTPKFKSTLDYLVPAESGATSMFADLYSFVMGEQIQSGLSDRNLINPDVLKAMQEQDRFVKQRGDDIRRTLTGYEYGEAHREYIYQGLAALWDNHASSTILNFKFDTQNQIDRPDDMVSNFINLPIIKQAGIKRIVGVGKLYGENEAAAEINRQRNLEALERVKMKNLMEKFFKGNDITKDELTKIAIHFDSNNNNANFKTIMREILKSNGQNTTALNRYYQAKSRVEKMYYLNQMRLANKRGTKDDAKTKQIIKKEKQKLEEQYKKAKSGLLFNSEELELVE